MIRDLLIDKKLFENIREKVLKEGDEELIKRNSLENAVLKKLRKKRSLKKYKKMGIRKSDLKEIIELADIVSLELFGGPSDYQIINEHPEWCSHCGTCCRESSPIFIHKDEINAILTFKSDLKDDIVKNRDYEEHFMFKKDLPCRFHDFEANRCKIYDVRPQVCRTYPLVLVGDDDKSGYVIDLRHKCDYSIHLVLEKSIILFDEAIRRLET